MRILYATDGSRAALEAAEALCQLPLEADAKVTALAVSDPKHEQEAYDGLLASRNALAHCTAALETELRHGHPAELILEAAEELHADLIVLGASGKSAIRRFLIGSVAERVARHAPCSVLVVRPGHAKLQRVMLGLDASDEAAEAARWLSGFPFPDGAEVRVVTFMPNLHQMVAEGVLLQPPIAAASTTLAEWMRKGAQERLDATVSALQSGGLRAFSEVRSGDPGFGLLQAAEDESADLLVVGSRGQGAVERFFLESVSDTLLRDARCSVLMVRPPRRSAGVHPASAQG